MIILQRTGPLALLQDQGRPGLAALGVAPSGAADRAAYGLANRLVGNAPDCAVIETVLGGLVLTATTTHWVVITGAPTEIVIGARSSSSYQVLALRPGESLTVQPPGHGLRNYVAVRGGLLGDVVLGSRSTDVLSGLGPAPLVAGQQLAVGTATGDWPGVDAVAPPEPVGSLEALPGPRQDWFSAATWEEFLGSTWTVTPDSDRVAARLSGPALRPVHDRELPSEGLVRGAIQVPPSGQPLIFLADHPITGGYPVIAVLTDCAADHAAQVRPGDAVTFSGQRSAPEREQVPTSDEGFGRTHEADHAQSGLRTEF